MTQHNTKYNDNPMDSSNQPSLLYLALQKKSLLSANKILEQVNLESIDFNETHNGMTMLDWVMDPNENQHIFGGFNKNKNNFFKQLIDKGLDIHYPYKGGSVFDRIGLMLNHDNPSFFSYANYFIDHYIDDFMALNYPIKVKKSHQKEETRNTGLLQYCMQHEANHYNNSSIEMLFKRLLDKGFSENTKDQYGCPPFFYSTYNRPDLFLKLNKEESIHFDFTIKDNQNHGFLDYIEKHHDLFTIDQIIGSIENFSEKSSYSHLQNDFLWHKLNRLDNSISRGKQSEIRQFLKKEKRKGIDINNITNRRGNNILHFFLLHENYAGMKILSNNKKQWDNQNKNQVSTFMFAMFNFYKINNHIYWDSNKSLRSLEKERNKTFYNMIVKQLPKETRDHLDQTSKETKQQILNKLSQKTFNDYMNLYYDHLKSNSLNQDILYCANKTHNIFALTQFNNVFHYQDYKGDALAYRNDIQPCFNKQNIQNVNTLLKEFNSHFDQEFNQELSTETIYKQSIVSKDLTGLVIQNFNTITDYLNDNNLEQEKQDFYINALQTLLYSETWQLDQQNGMKNKPISQDKEKTIQAIDSFLSQNNWTFMDVVNNKLLDELNKSQSLNSIMIKSHLTAYNQMVKREKTNQPINKKEAKPF